MGAAGDRLRHRPRHRPPGEQVNVSRKRGLAGLAVVSAVLLTGCGSVPDLNPGVAARIGDDTFTTSDVHDTATAYCDAQKPQEGQALPQRYINGIVAGSLALRAAADQL